MGHTDLSVFSAAWFSLSVYKLRCDIRRELSAKEFLIFYILYILVLTRLIDEL